MPAGSSSCQPVCQWDCQEPRCAARDMCQQQKHPFQALMTNHPALVHPEARLFGAVAQMEAMAIAALADGSSTQQRIRPHVAIITSGMKVEPEGQEV